jgi:transketolase
VTAKFEAFGWHVQRVDGNDIAAVRTAFDNARAAPAGKPRAIIFNTLMCKGVPFLETREITHFIRVEPHEWQLALQALEEGKPS